MDFLGSGLNTRRRFMYVIAAVAALTLSSGSFASGNAEVNPFIGTGGMGYGVGSAFPGPCVPFGMARPGPDTARLGTHVSFHHCGGYHYFDNQIRGFSHTRLSGIGLTEYGNVMVMPTLNMSGRYGRESSYRADFDHASETASPGYYGVTLKGSGIRAELTATHHCGLHRYTFPKKGPGRIIVNAAHAISEKAICGAEVEADPDDGEIFGKVHHCGSLTRRNGGVEIFFAARINGPVRHSGLDKQNAVAWMEVDSGPDRPVEVAVGISFISVSQARAHLDEEIGQKSFDMVKAEAEASWREALSVIEITGGTADQRAMFYTALYHSMIMPTDFTEAGGLYRGFDERVHKAEGFRYYTDFSMWDTFRTLHPLLNLIAPDRSADMMQSLVTMAEQGGYLPKWPTAYRYTSCMIGASADNVIADAYLKGVRGFDAERAYRAMRDLAMNPVPEPAGYDGRAGVREYIDLGYVPADRYGGAASRTIEFSYNDFCIAQMARAMGNEEDYEMFMERSKNWQNIRDERTGYLRGRKSDGSFKGPFVPWSWTGYYVEGNARQWLWAPLHDAQGLIEVMDGPEAFVERLNEFFEKSAKRPDTFLWDNFYWHGNEPDIHAAYLFNYAGRPDLTRKWVRWIMEAKYKNAPNGLDGNDDCGTLSAWYVFSALGFYPVAGTDAYLVGYPLFERAVLHLRGGDLDIRTGGGPAGHARPVKVLLNGRPLSGPWFRHSEIASGGELVFETDQAAGPGK
jgi:predicted alpha-1,2-mannosidase